jgi:hypothetical protein
MRKSFVQVLFVSVCLVLIAGCATTVPLESSFWDRKGVRVGVALATLPDAHAHRVGGEMLLDMAINKAMAAKLDTRMRQVAPKMIGGVTDKFVQRLNEKGFKAKKISEQIPLDAFPKFTGQASGNARMFGKDLRGLAQKHNIDMLLLVTVNRYGTLRNYYGFIPLGNPRALFDVRGQMIDLANNQLLWQTQLSDDQATMAVEGEWSQPPEYPNLVASLEQAMNKSMGHLETQFFATSR